LTFFTTCPRSLLKAKQSHNRQVYWKLIVSFRWVNTKWLSRSSRTHCKREVHLSTVFGPKSWVRCQRTRRGHGAVFSCVVKTKT
uniref:Secreted protein n=1 Tax=Schistocephalus solidus TaxID=70667 RepID=A0A183SCS6_SCHSO